MTNTKQRMQRLRNREQRVPLAVRRSGLTYLAAVSDNPEIQRRLPQFLIGSEHTLPLSLFRKHAVGRTDSLRLLRCRSSWMTATFFARLVKAVGDAVAEPFARTHHLVLSMDSCPSHLSPLVFKAAASRRLLVLVVGAHMTPWMQPLDTHVFAPLKRALYDRMHEWRAETDKNDVDKCRFLTVTGEIVSMIVSEGDWSKAFAHCGLTHQQRLLSRTLRTKLEYEAAPAVQDALPTLAQFQCLFPRGYTIPFDSLFRLVLPNPRGRDDKHAASDNDEIAEPPALPWHARLRSASRLTLAQVTGNSSSQDRDWEPVALDPSPNTCLLPPEAMAPPRPLPRASRLPHAAQFLRRSYTN